MGGPETNKKGATIVEKTGNVTANNVDGIVTGIKNRHGTALVGESGYINADKRVNKSHTGIVVRKDGTGKKEMVVTGNIKADNVKQSSTGIVDED